MAVVGDGEVVVVVGVARIGVGGTLEDGGAVFALAGLGYGLVVDDLGEGEAGGDEGEGGFGFGIFCGVEVGQAEVEIGFEG